MKLTHVVTTLLALTLLPGEVQAQQPPSRAVITEVPNHYILREGSPIVLCDATSGPVQVFLPVAPHAGQTVDLLKIDDSHNACILHANGKPVEYPSALSLTKSTETIRLRFDGKDWRKR